MGTAAFELTLWETDDSVHRFVVRECDAFRRVEMSDCGEFETEIWGIRRRLVSMRWVIVRSKEDAICVAGSTFAIVRHAVQTGLTGYSLLRRR